MKRRILAVVFAAACLFVLLGCLQNVTPPSAKTFKIMVPNLMGG